MTIFLVVEILDCLAGAIELLLISSTSFSFSTTLDLRDSISANNWTQRHRFSWSLTSRVFFST